MAGSDAEAWEYLILPAAERDRLPALGRDGWELVAVTGDTPTDALYLKRRPLDFRSRVTLEQKARYYRALGLAPETTTE